MRFLWRWWHGKTGHPDDCVYCFRCMRLTYGDDDPWILALKASGTYRKDER